MVASTAARHPAEQRGFVARLLTTMAKAICGLCFALVFSIAVEWIGMVFWWPEEGIGHSERMLAQELTYLNRDFRRSVVTSDTVEFVRKFMWVSDTVLMEWTGFESLIAWLEKPMTVKAVYRTAADFVTAAVMMTQLFALRMAVLTLAMPAFLIFSVVALVDGL